MPRVTLTEVEIPGGQDCHFSNGNDCPLLRGNEYSGGVYCANDPRSSLKKRTGQRQRVMKSDACLVPPDT